MLIDFETARKNVLDILRGKISTPVAIKVVFAMKDAAIDPSTLRPKGEWIDISQVVRSLDGDWFAEQYKCSLCGRKEYNKEPFCNCGADMRGEDNGC